MSSAHGSPSAAEVAARIDHTLLDPGATRVEILACCREALTYSFAGVCVAGSWLPDVVEALAGSPVKAITVVGFPLGTETTLVKAFASEEAARLGADEIDAVIHLGRAHEGDWAAVTADLRTVVEAADGRPVKAILETARFEPDVIRDAACAAVDAGAAFVKTSTGFGVGGATVEAVRLLRETVGNDVGVKASGGIKTLADARAMLAAGASRLGASASVAIVTSP
ncbi:MAG: deoxyribose-phosphate aldolase [Planctomycetota bacterium]|jgi:deoxyribose-phosphate aldolase